MPSPAWVALSPAQFAARGRGSSACCVTDGAQSPLQWPAWPCMTCHLCRGAFSQADFWPGSKCTRVMCSCSGIVFAGVGRCARITCALPRPDSATFPVWFRDPRLSSRYLKCTRQCRQVRLLPSHQAVGASEDRWRRWVPCMSPRPASAEARGAQLPPRHRCLCVSWPLVRDLSRSKSRSGRMIFCNIVLGAGLRVA